MNPRNSISFLKFRSFSTSSTYYNDVGVRVRFAPSPTGDIHLGGLRTAFYNYIFAKQNGGKFIVRIEDTDQTRIVPGSAEAIEKVLNWAGLEPDESPSLGGKYGPYLQSARLDKYKQKANELLESGKAYRCFCSQERLDLLRKHQLRNREKIRYDKKCKHLSPKEIKEKLSQSQNSKHVIRFGLQPGPTIFSDMIFGDIRNDLSLESDPIIIKSDGFPTYHFANVVDDHEMKISHVLRGSEWISSTAKHIQIYKSLDWTEPKFFHFPLIVMKDGSKMSKRNNQSHVKSWIEAGYRPLAILNFLTNMGGGVPKEKQDSNELWGLEKIIEGFSFEHVSCHAGSVDVDRLNIYNEKELQRVWRGDAKKLLRLFKELLDKNNLATDLDDSQLRAIIDKHITRIVTLNDLISKDRVYIWHHPNLTWSIEEYTSKGWNVTEIVKDLIRGVNEVNIEDKNVLGSSIKDIASKHGIDRALLMRFIRKVLTNSESGLPVHEIVSLLGRSRFLSYLKEGLKYVSKS